MPPSLAQLGGRTTSPAYTSQSAADTLPKPQSRAGAVGYAVAGLILLALIFAAVIWLKGQHD